MSQDSEHIGATEEASFTAADLMRELAEVSQTSLDEVAPGLVEASVFLPPTSEIDTVLVEQTENRIETDVTQELLWLHENMVDMLAVDSLEDFDALVGRYPTTVDQDIIQELLNRIGQLRVDVHSINAPTYSDEHKFTKITGIWLSLLFRNVPEPSDPNDVAEIYLVLPEAVQDDMKPDRLGFGLSGRIAVTIEGDVGRMTGRLMSGGDLTIHGNAERGAGIEMSGGRLVVSKNAGMSTGSMMTGGELIVEGDVGEHPGTDMSGGKLLIKGNSGELTGTMMQGGRIIIEGNSGNDTGFEMTGGQILVLGDSGILNGRNARGGQIQICGTVPEWGIPAKRSKVTFIEGTGATEKVLRKYGKKQ